jgi:hypothetical protein
LLAVKAGREEIRSSLVLPSSCPPIELSFLVPYFVKAVTFEMREEADD